VTGATWHPLSRTSPRPTPILQPRNEYFDQTG
jgi:hypothetical protein